MLFFDCQNAGIGAILCDDKGEVIMVVSIKEKALFQPETIECLTILHGLQQCITLGMSHLVVVSDCQSIV